MTGCHRLSVAAAASLLITAPIGARQQVQQIAEVTQKPPATTRPKEAPPVAQGVQVTPAPHPDQRTPESIGLRGFSVALVLGEMQGTTTADTLPAGARKAITDMKDFLPYKNYRILDVQWTLCCSGRTPTGITGRLRGLDEDDHWFQVWVREVIGPKMSVAFSLREPEGGEDEIAAAVFTNVERERRASELRAKRDELEAAVAQARQRYGENHPEMQARRVQLDAAKRELEMAERSTAKGERKDLAPRGKGRPLLESTFSMEVGETVVIGTSRLKGDKALIALLTAASRPSSSGR